MIKANTGKHTMQKPHDADHCEINAPEHNHPDMDCGHPVDSGPGVGMTDFDGAGNDDTKTTGESKEPGTKL